MSMTGTEWLILGLGAAAFWCAGFFIGKLIGSIQDD